MKILLKVLGLIVLFVIVAAVAFIALFDPNEYKPEIEQQVQQATGRTLTIDGDIGLSIIPIGLELNQVQLSNASGFEQPIFAGIESLVIKVGLIPLLQKRLVVDALQLDGLSLFLEIDAKGNNNWQDLAAAEDSGQSDDAAPVQDATPADQQEQQASASPLAALAVNGIEINDASIVFDDRQNDSLVSISGFTLTTGSISFGEAFEFSLAALVNQKAADVEQIVQIDLEADITVQQSLKQFAVDNLVLAVKATLPQIQQDDLELGVLMDAAVDLATETANITRAEIDTGYADLMLKLQVSNWSDALVVRGELASDEINPRELAARFDITLPPMQAADAMSSLQLKTGFDLSAGVLKATPDILFDDSKIGAELDVTLATQAVRYRLDIDQIDANRYMPPPPPDQEADADTVGDAGDTATAAAPEQDLPIPVELIRTLDIEGDVAVGSARVLDYDLSDIKARTKVKDGIVKLSPVTLSALKGELAANASMDVRKDIPVFSTDIAAKDIHIGPITDPILNQLIAGQEVVTTGSGDVYADVVTRGKRISVLMQAVDGKFGFRFEDSQLQGLDVDQFVKASVQQAIDDAGNPLGYSYDYSERYDPETKTAFDVMRGDFKLNQGVAVSNNLLMDGSKLRVTGKARVDIVKLVLDSTVTANRKIANPSTTGEQLENEPITVRAYGPVAALQYDVDYSKIIGAISKIASEKLGKAVDEKKAELRKSLDGKVDKQELDDKKQQLDNKKDALKDKLKQKLKLF